MDKYMNKLIKRYLGTFMNRSRDKIALSDKLYKRDLEDSAKLEERYNALKLDKKERMLINDYISCLMARENRMADISYIAGVGDAIRFLNAIGLLEGSKKDNGTSGTM
ncbi:MAG TPA: hypothetical protein DCZ91_12985 [Lachnospiraceae bacterium]|nr:hypothetical protein [Lachnospiraceae bacterium]